LLLLIFEKKKKKKKIQLKDHSVEAIDRRETLRSIAENPEIVLHLLSKRSIAVRIAIDRLNPSESSKPSVPAIDRSEHCERSLNPLDSANFLSKRTIAMNMAIDRLLTLRPSAHEHSTAHLHNQARVRSIANKRDRTHSSQRISDLF
jgi:hypothetical protein